MSVTFPCSKCMEDCTETEACIQCSRCERWVHITCVPMTESELKTWDNHLLKFYCPPCCYNGSEFDTVLSLERSPSQLDGDGDEQGQGHCTSIWQEVPDSILLHIFSFLEAHSLTVVAQTCKVWNRVANDETLWRSLLRVTLREPNCNLATGKKCWKQEYKRVYFHSPVVHTETLREHTDEVLHVSFAHRGHMFSTTSKDATLRVWSVGNPTELKYMKDFRQLFGWDFTQFSCFNESDTMLLVSSVQTTEYMDRRGYMAIMSLIHDFKILRLVTMDPSQLFGAWLDDNTFLGGCLEISLDRFATTVQIEAYEVPEIFSTSPTSPPVTTVEETSGRPLFTFSSETASLIKFLSVAAVVPSSCRNCSSKAGQNLSASTKDDSSFLKTASDNSSVHTKNSSQTLTESGDRLQADSGLGVLTVSKENLKDADCGSVSSSVLAETDSLSHISESSSHNSCIKDDLKTENSDDSDSSATIKPKKIKVDCSEVRPSSLKGQSSEVSSECCSDLESEHFASSSDCNLNNNNNSQRTIIDSQGLKRCRHLTGSPELSKNLIFVTGEFAVALHQLGFKNVPSVNESSARGRTLSDSNVGDSYMVVNYSNNDIHIVHRQDSPDKPDNLIDLFGHVTGLCLSKDQRYLYINCRPWIGDVDRSDPWATPDLSPNIEVRIIDLFTLKDVGVRYVGHKGYSPSTMCCFVFLDVSQDYVASGSEDAKGYLWDKHYHSLLANFEHESGVVNAVGFNPVDQEYLVTVCDDGTIKVWRSRQKAIQFSKCSSEK